MADEVEGVSMSTAQILRIAATVSSHIIFSMTPSQKLPDMQSTHRWIAIPTRRPKTTSFVNG